MQNTIVVFDVFYVIEKLQMMYPDTEREYIAELAFDHFNLLRVLVNERIHMEVNKSLNELLPLLYEEGVSGEVK